jgi:hypothetical protein
MRARLSVRGRARLTLTIVAAIGIATLLNRPPEPFEATGAPSPERSDAAMFKAITERLRMGEPYYQALGTELRSGGYPTGHVFNWRTPLLLEGIAAAPRLSGAVLTGLGLVLALLTITMSPRAAVAGVAAVMQIGTLALIAAPQPGYFGELWAGLFIALSVCLFAKGQPSFAAVLGLAALFFRELAAPYCVVCALLALRRRRHRELAVWIAGACVYAVFYGLHIRAVWAHQRPGDLSHRASWLQFGGLEFLVSVVDFQSWLMLLPWPLEIVALLVLVAAVLSPAPIHLRLATAIYLGFFFCVGQAFNTYWSFVAWPTWAMACGYGLDHLVTETRVAFGRAELEATTVGSGR